MVIWIDWCSDFWGLVLGRLVVCWGGVVSGCYGIVDRDIRWLVVGSWVWCWILVSGLGGYGLVYVVMICRGRWMVLVLLVLVNFSVYIGWWVVFNCCIGRWLVVRLVICCVFGRYFGVVVLGCVDVCLGSVLWRLVRFILGRYWGVWWFWLVFSGFRFCDVGEEIVYVFCWFCDDFVLCWWVVCWIVVRGFWFCGIVWLMLVFCYGNCGKC